MWDLWAGHAHHEANGFELRCASEPEGSDVLIAVVVLSVGSYCVVARGFVLGHLAGVVGGHGDLSVGKSERKVQHYVGVWRDGGVDGHLLLGSVEETEESQGSRKLGGEAASFGFSPCG